MADQIPDFVDGDTGIGNRVTAAWLNDVNDATYRGSAIFTPSGAGAVARSGQDALRAAARRADYNTAANFLVAVTSLTEAFGAATLNIGPQTGWTAVAKTAFVD